MLVYLEMAVALPLGMALAWGIPWLLEVLG